MAVNPPEVFIFVRPPPSAKNHPLNLQVQLVTPSHLRAGNASSRSLNRSSGEFSRDAPATPTTPTSQHTLAASYDAVATSGVSGAASTALARTPSYKSSGGRSNRSMSSASSTGGGAITRQVVPLYNLQFHSVMKSTLVTDAGTDAKVAKFLNRGIDVLGLAILDPVELFPQLSPSLNALNRSLSAASSAGSPVPVPASPAAPPPPQAQEQSLGGLLGKFKRMSFNRPASNGGSAPANQPPAVVAAISSLLSKSDSTQSLQALTNDAGQPVIPLFRTPSAEADGLVSSAPPVRSLDGTGRKGYSWTVRKWTRKGVLSDGKDEGRKAARSVRFEWRRADKVRRGTGASTASELRPALETFASGSSSDGLAPAGGPPNGQPVALRRPSPSPRRSTDSRAGLALDPNSLAPTTSRSRPASIAGSERSRSPGLSEGRPSGQWDREDDDGDESDPEDSDRVWSCEVVYSGAAKEGKETRLLLGKFKPAPHHPKLIGSLHIPFSLSPIALPTGAGAATERLSVEEMKDVLSVTCLWLLVHENLGGVGRRRKGDGSWRIK